MINEELKLQYLRDKGKKKSHLKTLSSYYGFLNIYDFDMCMRLARRNYNTIYYDAVYAIIPMRKSLNGKK